MRVSSPILVQEIHQKNFNNVIIEKPASKIEEAKSKNKHIFIDIGFRDGEPCLTLHNGNLVEKEQKECNLDECPEKPFNVLNRHLFIKKNANISGLTYALPELENMSFSPKTQHHILEKLAEIKERKEKEKKEIGFGNLIKIFSSFKSSNISQELQTFFNTNLSDFINHKDFDLKKMNPGLKLKIINGFTKSNLIENSKQLIIKLLKSFDLTNKKEQEVAKRAQRSIALNQMLFQTYEEEEFDAIRKHLNVNKKYEEWNFQSEIEAEVYFHIVENYDVEFFTNYVLKDGIEVDFYFPKHKLIIELDGLHHNTQKYQVSDEERDQMLFHKFSDADLEIETIIRLKLENLSTYKTLNYIDDFFKQAQIEKYDYDFNSLY